MTTETIDIVVKQSGAKQVAKDIDQIGVSAQRSESMVDKLSKMLKTIGAAAAAKKVLDYANAWGDFNNKVRSATSTAAEFEKVQKGLVDVALRTGQSLQSVSDMYQTMSISATELGKSQDEMLKFTRLVSQELANSGVGAGQAKDALLQLSQALGSGTVRAQEFNSVLSGAPSLMKRIAENVDGAGGSIAKLREIMNSGGLKSTAVFDAILKSQKSIEEQAKKMPLTMSSAFTNLQTQLIKFIGQMDESFGVTSALAKGIQFIADHMRELAGLVTGVGAAIAVAFSPVAVAAFGAKLSRVWLLMRAHPLVAIASAIGGVIGYLSQFKDEIRIAGEGSATLGTLATTAFDKIKASISSTIGSVIEFGKRLWDSLSFGQLGSVVSSFVKKISGYFANFFSGVGDGWTGFAVGIARVLDSVSAIMKRVVGTIWGFWGDLFKTIFEAGKRAFNAIGDGLVGAVNTAIAGINKLTGSNIAEVKFKWRADEGEFENIFDNMKKRMNAENEHLLEKWIRELIGDANKAQQVIDKLKQSADDASKATANIKMPKEGNAANGGNVVMAGGLSDKNAELLRWLQEMQRAIDPINAAMKEFAERSRFAMDAVEDGTITLQQYNQIISHMTEQYRGVLNPMGEMLAGLEREAEMIGKSREEREADNRVMQIVADLKSKGVVATEEETKAIHEQIKAMQEQAKIAQIVEEMKYESSAGRASNITDQIKALTQSGLQGQDFSDQVNRIYGFAQEDSFNRQLTQYQNYLSQLDQLKQQEIINEQQYSQIRMQIQQQENDLKLANASNYFGALSGLSTNSNRTLARIGKAAAISQATINMYQAASKAYAEGGIMGAVTSAQVMTQVVGLINQISSQNPRFMTGGSFTVGGSGGTDSQMVSFRASPGERVTVATPAQVRKGTAAVVDGGNGSGVQTATITPKIINVLDPGIVGDYLKTDEGEQIVMNIIQRNKSQLAEL
nr:MAG TPA: Tail tape measure [Caudoviricetes sp.]